MPNIKMRINISPLWSKLGIEDEVSLVQQLYDVYFGEETNIGEIVHINGFQVEQYIRRNANVCSFRNKDTIKNFIDHQVVTRVDHDGSTFPYFDKILETDVYKVLIDWDNLNKYAGILQDYEADESYGLSKQKQLLKSTIQRIDEASKTKKFAVTERILGQYSDHIATAQQIRADNSPDRYIKFIETLRSLEREGFLKIHKIEFNFDALPVPTEEESRRLEEGFFVDEDANFYPAEHCQVTIELTDSKSQEAVLIRQADEQAIRPKPTTAKSVSEAADWGMEELWGDEIQLINKLLQICNKESMQWVPLMHPAHLADNVSDKAGFDKIEIVKDLHKVYKVFKKFNLPVDSVRSRGVHIIKAEIDYQKLRERAESLHDEVESWKGIALGIEEQKKKLMKRIKYDFNKFANDETFTISESILGTYNAQISSKPLGFSLSRPDKNRPDINFEFMRALRALEKDGHFTIEEVDIDFNAQPQPTAEALEKAKWSFGTREVNEFYPPEHCTVTIRPKVLEIVRDAAKAVMQTVQANRGVLVEQVKRLQESGPAIAEAVKNAQKSAEILRDINKPLISTDSFVVPPSKSYEALLLEEQIEINRQILEKLEQKETTSVDNAPEEIENGANKPHCMIEKSMGYLKFGKYGLKKKIGRADGRPFKFLQAAIEPLGVYKSVDAIMTVIWTEKDSRDPRLTNPNTAKTRKVEIIQNSCIKELQKGNKLDGKIKFEFNDSETQLRARLME